MDGDADMADHTPGPWGRHNGIIALIDENNIRTKRIARVDYRMGPDEREANARLIVAAPDLLEALDKLLTLTVFELGSNADREPWKRNIERSRAAIAKAEGRQP
jgi:hypothetical protein